MKRFNYKGTCWHSPTQTLDVFPGLASFPEMLDSARTGQECVWNNVNKPSWDILLIKKVILKRKLYCILIVDDTVRSARSLPVAYF